LIKQNVISANAGIKNLKELSMDVNSFISSLEASAKKIKSLLEGVTDEQAKWKPAPENKSVYLRVIPWLQKKEKFYE
jgi:hypothetical protein